MGQSDTTGGINRLEFLKLGAAGLIAGVAGVSAGCSAGRPATATSNVTSKVTMIYVPDVLPHLIPQIARSAGIYTKNGVEATLIASDQPLTPVLSGSADVAFPAPSVLAQAIGQGQSVKALVQVFKNNLDTFMVRPELAAKLKNKGKFPQILRELKGMRIGESEAGDGLDHDLRYMIKLAGLSASDFSIVPTSGGQAEVNALLTGQVDAVIADHPQVDQVVASGQGVIVLDLAQGQGPPGMQFSYVVAAAEASWVASNPVAARRFVSSIVATEAWIRTRANKAKLTGILNTLLPGLSAPVLEKVYQALVVSSYPQITQSDVQKIGAYSQLAGLTTKPLTYREFVATGLGLPS
jgi:NitT/TauT family transport system substrate-binding protein